MIECQGLRREADVPIGADPYFDRWVRAWKLDLSAREGLPRLIVLDDVLKWNGRTSDRPRHVEHVHEKEHQAHSDREGHEGSQTEPWQVTTLHAATPARGKADLLQPHGNRRGVGSCSKE